MKVKVSVAIGILIGLQQLDQQIEKVTPEVRLKVAIMINKLRPDGDAYDRTQARIVREAYQAHENPQLRDAFMTESLAAARDVEVDIEDRKLTKDELNLKENPKVNSLTLANLIPILEGIEVA